MTQSTSSHSTDSPCIGLKAPSLRHPFQAVAISLLLITAAPPTSLAGEYKTRSAPANPPKPVRLSTRPAIPPQRNPRLKPESLGQLLGFSNRKATLAEIEPFIRGDLNRRDEVMKFDTLLLRAIWYRREDVARVLVERGADVNLPANDKEWLPICSACERGMSLPFIQFLLSKGARLDPNGTNHWTLLHLAAGGGNVELAQFLITKGFDVNAVRSDGTPLERAIGESQLEMVRFLITKGANVQQRDKSKRTLLHSACTKRNVKIIELLLASGVEVNARDKYGRTPLTVAADNDFKETVVVLKKHGAVE